ncbi:site-specific DNA-methyltransferase [Leptothoe sp. ISB3NOV94-8A]
MINFVEGNAVDKLAELLNTQLRWCYCLTSVPYYSQIDYGFEQQLGLEPTSNAYIEAMVSVFHLIYQGMDEGGVLWLNIQDTINGYSTVRSGGRRQGNISFRRKPEEGYRSGEPLRIPERLTERLCQQGWFLLETKIWDKGQSSQPHRGQRTGTTHESIIIMGKSRYSRPKLHIRADVETVLRIALTKHRNHPCPMPYDLAHRLLSCATRDRATLIDPFCGTGTSLIAAHDYAYDAIGIDLDIGIAQEEVRLKCTDIFWGISRYA